MKYIDERVIFDFVDLDLSFNNDILRYDVLLDDEIIFIGNIFVENDPPKIDITDILKNYFDVNHDYTATPNRSNIFRKVDVRLSDRENNEYTTLTDNILYIYHYPNYNSKVNTPVFDFEYYETMQTQPMLQGWDFENNKGYFLPTYPKRDSDVFNFDMSIAKGVTIMNNRFRVRYPNDLEYLSDVIQLDTESGIYNYSIPMSDLLKEIEVENGTLPYCEAQYIELTTYTSINQRRITYKIANLDGSSRYFLKWRDRYGMTQCQPFGGTTKYSENITQNKIVNYKNSKKITDITNTSKWLLNTKWVTQDLYPFYESIFVSPYLILYDAYEDKMYNVVLVTTEYEEKTFKNQNRNLFNLQIEVELDTTEYMIY